MEFDFDGSAAKDDLLLSKEDWYVVEHSLQILKPFYEVTTKISVDRYVPTLEYTET